MNLTFKCRADNDLYSALAASNRVYPRYPTASEAIEKAAAGAAVLVLADDYPDSATAVSAALFDRAAEKRLRLFIEYPLAIPGFEVGAPQRAVWERGVVATDRFGELLPRLRILALHRCRFVPVSAGNPWLVAARVAGFDRAVYDLPNQTFPILFEAADRNLWVATTKLSCFITARYAPSYAWKIIWEQILAILDPRSPSQSVSWTPAVRVSFGPCNEMPPDGERRAFDTAARWHHNSRLLIHPSRLPEIVKRAAATASDETIATPGNQAPVGDGSLGTLEGFAASIEHDGSQPQRIPIRADCNAESALVLALDWVVNGNSQSRAIANHLLDYVYFTSGMHGGVRANPAHPAFGLIAWGALPKTWEAITYNEDNARVILATALASACLGTDRWEASMLKALLANLRTTGTLGFQRDLRVELPLLERRGWRAYNDSTATHPFTSRESYMWACYLWAYARTGYQPFLDKAKAGIRITMEERAVSHLWRDAGECARMLLSLAWLLRVEDLPEHRRWLQSVAEDLRARQQPCGALQENIETAFDDGLYQPPSSNEAYGTSEAPLLQQNGDPVSDQLYAAGFALVGLREAAAVTGDEALKAMENKLTDFLCRIQVRSDRYPYLNGAWFRAFDFRQWECWASSADQGWGAWSIEAGWGPAWIAVVLALRLMKTSLWDHTSSSRICAHLQPVLEQMSHNDGSPMAEGD